MMNNFTQNLCLFLFTLLFLILVFVLIAFICKKSSIFFTFTLVLLLSALGLFLIDLNNGKFYTNDLRNVLNNIQLGNALCNLILILAKPVQVIHNTFILLIESTGANEDFINFFENQWFYLIFYIALFIIAVISKISHKKEKRTYSDYDS